jgi:hypothetical protein
MRLRTRHRHCCERRGPSRRPRREGRPSRGSFWPDSSVIRPSKPPRQTAPGARHRGSAVRYSSIFRWGAHSVRRSDRTEWSFGVVRLRGVRMFSLLVGTSPPQASRLPRLPAPLALELSGPPQCGRDIRIRVEKRHSTRQSSVLLEKSGQPHSPRTAETRRLRRAERPSAEWRYSVQFRLTIKKP